MTQDQPESAAPSAGVDGSLKMYVIQWTDAWGRLKERTVWSDNRFEALRQVQKSTARIVSPNAPGERLEAGRKT